jgi:hypothetical protein
VRRVEVRESVAGSEDAVLLRERLERRVVTWVWMERRAAWSGHRDDIEGVVGGFVEGVLVAAMVWLGARAGGSGNGFFS